MTADLLHTEHAFRVAIRNLGRVGDEERLTFCTLKQQKMSMAY